ncbi:hypothetical protein HOY82DRAFT_647017 [Tuber indicum]|nr:hypothetical protein HOY82DRAFT_647017 [Tuber indicum]
MSQMPIEHSFLETFNSLVEHEDFLSPDNESFISLFDNEPGCSEPCNAGIDFTCPSITNSHEEGGVEKAEIVGSGAPDSDHKSSTSYFKRRLESSFTDTTSSKRAKTEEEKEQRRIERILRNHAAAQSSRERKQKEVEVTRKERQHLADCNADMRVRLAAVEESNQSLRQQLGEMQQMLKRYEDHMRVAACDVAVNAMVKPADPVGPTSLWGAAEQTVTEEESICQFLDNIVDAPPTTINPKVLGGPMRQGWGETIIN